MATKDKSPILLHEDLYAKAPGSGSGGSGNNGIGGGGGSPGGGSPGGGGGGKGGKPGEDSYGNNLSFPAVFFEEPTWLRGDSATVTFTTPTHLSGDTDYVYFAQGVEGNIWQAGSIVATDTTEVKYVDIGDALETAPLKAGTNVRLELTMYEELDAPLTAFEMTLLGGAKGSGKPTVKGPTESQGARLDADLWPGDWTNASAPDGTTYASEYASVYAAESTGGETANSYMSMSIQKVTGVDSVDDLDDLTWNGTVWMGSGVGPNLFNTAFGPELNIAGKYIMGASGKPFKFTSDGDYLITFAIENDAPVRFDSLTLVANDLANEDEDPLLNEPGFQPDPYDALEDAYRETWVIPDGESHNGLLVMLVGIPSSVEGGEG